jgi:hypothetical protein
MNTNTVPTAHTFRYTLPEAGALAILPAGAHPNENKHWLSRSWDAPKSAGWDNNTGLPGAVSLLENGWREAPQQFHNLFRRLRLELETDRADVEYQFAPAGDEVDVTRYLAGERDCFLESRVTTKPGDSPVVRLYVSCSAAWTIDAALILRRGAAVTALCDALERSGKSVEISMVCSVTSRNAKNEWQGKAISLEIAVKRAWEYMRPDRLAFALGHPAFLRRIVMRLMEQIPAPWRDRYTLPVSAYGTPCDAAEYVSKAALYLPALVGNNPASYEPFGDDKTTAAWLRTTLAAQGVKVEGG